VVVSGEEKIDMADPEGAKELRRGYIQLLKNLNIVGMNYMDIYHKFGTSGAMIVMIKRGSAPIKNWGGVAEVDFPDFMGLGPDKAAANLAKIEGCWHCPVSCKGVMKEGTKYKYPAGAKRPEYETIASFGSMCVNSDMESIIMCNDICNRAGIDTISTGATIAFAIECYENGIINKKDTDGLELSWGNADAIVALTEKIVKQEGFGALLFHGVKVAAEKIGKGAEKYAVHVGGQEPGMHDPKFKHMDGDRVGAARFQMDATPGKHNQGFGPDAFEVHLSNAASYCIQGGYWMIPEKEKYMCGFLTTVTGWSRTMEELHFIGDRIATLRHCFNLREGINPRKDWSMHPRMIGAGEHVLKAGPHANHTVDLEAMIDRNLKKMDWDLETTVPSREKLIKLGLDDVADDFWPQK